MITSAPITYYKSFVQDPDAAFAALRDELKWEQRETPRQEYYCNDSPEAYVYGTGRGQRTYLPSPYHPIVRAMRADLEKLTGTVFEVCFLNRYLNKRNGLGWHADDSPVMDDARPIGIISLGSEREIWFRPNDREAAVESLKLGHGSLCLMAPGMQDLWRHRIPKASFECGERISLTFRGYVRSEQQLSNPEDNGTG